MTKRVPQISVIVPTYNERDNLAPLAGRLFAVLDSSDAELLIVDDDSPDGTAAVAKELGEKHPVRCIVRRGERGLATAVIRGLREARGELCVVMDADLSHPPEAIPRLLEAMGKAGTGAASEASGTDSEPASAESVPVFPDMAIGSRFVPGGKVDLHWPLHRRLNSWVARLLARPLTGVRDMMSGFFCVRRSTLRLDRLKPVGYKIALELIVRHRWRNVVEIPITFADRTAGKTKLNVGEQLRYLRHLWRLYGFALLNRGTKTP
jgi:dolichol-phosphate mannosyltransferase